MLFRSIDRRRAPHLPPDHAQGSQDSLPIESSFVCDLRARRSAQEPLQQRTPLPLRESQWEATRCPVVAAARTAAPATLQEPGLPTAASRALHDESSTELRAGVRWQE